MLCLKLAKYGVRIGGQKQDNKKFITGHQYGQAGHVLAELARPPLVTWLVHAHTWTSPRLGSWLASAAQEIWGHRAHPSFGWEGVGVQGERRENAGTQRTQRATS